MAELYLVEVEGDEHQYVYADSIEACREFVETEVDVTPKVIHLLGEIWIATDALN